MTTKHSTMSRQVCKMLADGVPRTTKQIAEAFGLDAIQASDVMVLLKATNRIKRLPVQYEITDAGRKFSEREPRVSKTHAEHNRAYRARKLEKQGLPVPVKKEPEPVSTVAIVESAIASRPALQRAWGAAWFADREVA